MPATVLHPDLAGGGFWVCASCGTLNRPDDRVCARPRCLESRPPNPQPPAERAGSEAA